MTLAGRPVRAAGFTLLELLITLGILGVLAGLTLPLAQITRQRSNEQELRRHLQEIRSAIDAYKKASDEGRLPRAAGASGYPPSLEILVEGVIDQRDPGRSKLYFLRRVPVDPMLAGGSPGESPNWGKRSYASEAEEPQEGEDVYDVFSLSPATGLNGQPYRRW